jgi:hypothetical protein
VGWLSDVAVMFAINCISSTFFMATSPQKSATYDSYQRAVEFLEQYAPRTPIAMEAARQTSFVPESMSTATTPTIVSMMMPRNFTNFPFLNFPNVTIGPMDPISGTQRVKVQTTEDFCIQSTLPMLPLRRDMSSGLDECFYSVKILGKDPDTSIAVGFATVPYPPFRLPGWDPNSVGYHSDDGSVFVNDADFGESLGPALKTGDEIGIGYKVWPIGADFGTSFYFTVNGTRLKRAFQESVFVPSEIYPTIGFDGNCEIEICFGNVNETFWH